MATKKTYKSKPTNVRTVRTRRRQDKQRKRLLAAMLVVILLLALLMLRSCFASVNISEVESPSFIQQNFIELDGHSRTGREMTKVHDIVIHYVANPGSSAKANRDYFNSSQSNVSSHFVVGLQGEVIQCVPLDEESSASNERNRDTISIEVCHPDSSGQFNGETYGTLVQLTAWLCGQLRLDEDDLIRHYDITGKLCPKYYVENPEAWEQFREDVKKAL